MTNMTFRVPAKPRHPIAKAKQPIRREILSDPIVLTLARADVAAILHRPDWEKLLGLYVFYTTAALEIREPVIVLTDSELFRCLNWQISTIRQVRRQLKIMGLIDVIEIPGENGQKNRVGVRVFSRVEKRKSENILARTRTRTPPIGGRTTQTKRSKSGFCAVKSEHTEEVFNRQKKDNQNRHFLGRKDSEKIEKRPVGNDLFLSNGIGHSPDERFDENMARILLESVSKRRVQKGRLKLSQWVEEIRKLRHIDQLSKAIIERLILWYANHWREKFVPILYHAKDLRAKFERLEVARKRYYERTKDIEQEDDQCRTVRKQLPNGRFCVEFHYSGKE